MPKSLDIRITSNYDAKGAQQAIKDAQAVAAAWEKASKAAGGGTGGGGTGGGSTTFTRVEQTAGAVAYAGVWHPLVNAVFSGGSAVAALRRMSRRPPRPSHGDVPESSSESAPWVVVHALYRLA